MDTIFALSSGQPPSGVAVIRLSGEDAFSAMAALIGKHHLQPRKAQLRRLKDPKDGTLIDEGLVLQFPAPQSFTGEDCAELQIHGSRAGLAHLQDVLVDLGLRPAEPGEFSRRAFSNGKMDLTSVEGLGDLLTAETRTQQRLAHVLTGGHVAALYDGWRAELLHIRALFEAELDFSDEDLPDDVLENARTQLVALREDMKTHVEASGVAERVRDGIKVVIIGPPNVGKSSLLNSLAKRDVAIVSPEAGTTRDSLEVHLDLGGYAVTCVDTAGLRATASVVEQEGIRRAKAHLNSADVVVRMSAPDVDTEFEVDLPDGLPELHVSNKADLGGLPGAGLALSLKTGAGLEAFLSKLTDLVDKNFALGEGVLTSQARHRVALKECLFDLADTLSQLSNTSPDLVLVAEHLRSAAQKLARIVGRSDVEDVLGAIFSSFCIGK